MKLTTSDIELIKLLLRSPDIGGGWRQCSHIVWERLIDQFDHDELLELDEEGRCVRLSEKGEIVSEYLI